MDSGFKYASCVVSGSGNEKPKQGFTSQTLYPRATIKQQKMLPAACVAPVVAPRLVKGAWGTLRERAEARHLYLDRQGQQKWVSASNNVFQNATFAVDYAGKCLAGTCNICQDTEISLDAICTEGNGRVCRGGNLFRISSNSSRFLLICY